MKSQNLKSQNLLTRAFFVAALSAASFSASAFGADNGPNIVKITKCDSCKTTSESTYDKASQEKHNASRNRRYARGYSIAEDKLGAAQEAAGPLMVAVSAVRDIPEEIASNRYENVRDILIGARVYMETSSKKVDVAVLEKIEVKQLTELAKSHFKRMQKSGIARNITLQELILKSHALAQKFNTDESLIENPEKPLGLKKFKNRVQEGLEFAFPLPDHSNKISSLRAKLLGRDSEGEKSEKESEHNNSESGSGN